jgi:DNA-binding CsgD family transcriptional regulator
MRLSRIFDVSTIAFIAFLATFLPYPPALTALSSIGSSIDDVSYFALPMMITCLVASVAMMQCSFVFKDERILTAPLFVIGIACYLVGSITYILLGFIGMTDHLLIIGAGILTGAGTLPLICAWGCHYAREDLSHTLLRIAVAGGIATALTWGISLLPGTLMFGFSLLCVAIGAGTPAFLALSGRLFIPQRDQESSQPLSFTQAVTKIDRCLWMPLVGYLVFAFMMTAREFSIVDTNAPTFSGVAAALLLVVLLIPLRARQPLIRIIFQLVLPLVSGLLLLLDSFPLQTVANLIGAQGIYLLFSVIGFIAIATVIAIAASGEYSPSVLFSAALALFAAAGLIGVAFTYATANSEDTGPIFKAISTVYLLCLILYPLVETWLKNEQPESDTPVSSSGTPDMQIASKQDYEDCCEKLAVAHSLSKREREIAYYMGRGHGAGYIAQTLMISENTARTHIRNIYRKTETSSREEFLKVLDDMM